MLSVINAISTGENNELVSACTTSNFFLVDKYTSLYLNKEVIFKYFWNMYSTPYQQYTAWFSFIQKPIYNAQEALQGLKQMSAPT